MINAPSINDEKKAARREFRDMRNTLSANERARLDSAICSHVTSCPSFISADTVLCYFPVKGEPNILPIAEEALRLKKTVAFPISHVESKRLTFHIISSLSELTEGAYRIPEPSAKAPVPTVLQNAVCIVPALAFDKNGKRLGYGGGYYDRFLAEFDGVSMGLAYDSFFVDELPTDSYDMTVNIIITEKGEVFLSE